MMLDPPSQGHGLPSSFAGLQEFDVSGLLRIMGGLREQAKLSAASSPSLFTNYEFIFILHFLTDLLAFVHAMSLCGLRYERCHFLYKPYLYPLVDEISEQLRLHGARVAPLIEGVTLERVVQAAIDNCVQKGGQIIVIEDGGYVVPLLHQPRFQDGLKHVRGAVEQTSKGMRADERIGELRIPLLDVARCDLKTEREPPLVAGAIWDNVKRLLFDFDLELDRPEVLVVGFGSIGRGLADLLQRLKYQVKVFDRCAEKRRDAAAAGHMVADDIVDLLTPELILIGVTGSTSIGRRELLSMQHNTVLVSASSDQLEIDVDALTALSEDPVAYEHYASGEVHYERYRLPSQRELVLVARGFPVNFWNCESLGPRLAQVALIPLFLAAAEVAANDSLPIGSPDVDTVNRLVQYAGVEGGMVF